MSEANRHFLAAILVSMRPTMASEPRPLFVPVGSNPARLFGMDAKTRACRLAENMGLECAEAADRAAIFANMAYAWDPAWLREISGRPGTVLTLGGKPVLANVPDGRDAAAVVGAMSGGGSIEGYETIDAETAELNNAQLRKRERPFVLPLDPAEPVIVEKAAYDGAYKGVTDVLTLYLWRKPAFHLTRWAAEAGMTPNMVTAIGAAFCLLAFYLFWIGSFWPGVAAGFVFMVLDTVDGKLARCTGSSSKWGNVFDHGIDLIHPPFWWWAWIHGLEGYGTPLEPVYATVLLWTIVGGYVLQRIIEGIFMRRFGRMHIHVWQRIDSQFRLITARRNPNMVILVAALLFGHPDTGIELVALWTLLSLIFHAVRLTQATIAHDRGEPITSWLA